MRLETDLFGSCNISTEEVDSRSSVYLLLEV